MYRRDMYSSCKDHSLASPLITSLSSFNPSAANPSMFFSLSSPNPVSTSRVYVLPSGAATASHTSPLIHHISSEYHVCALQKNEWERGGGGDIRFPIRFSSSRPRSSTFRYSVCRLQLRACRCCQFSNDFGRWAAVVGYVLWRPVGERNAGFEGV